MSEEMQTIEEDTPTSKPQSINDLKPKMKLNGIVTRIELYGAFIDLGIGVNALIHISQLGQEHVNRVADVLSVGQEVSVWVDKVDTARNQIMVSMIEPLAVDWNDLEIGQVYTWPISRSFQSTANGSIMETIIWLRAVSTLSTHTDTSCPTLNTSATRFTCSWPNCEIWMRALTPIPRSINAPYNSMRVTIPFSFILGFRSLMLWGLEVGVSSSIVCISSLMTRFS